MKKPIQFNTLSVMGKDGKVYTCDCDWSVDVSTPQWLTYDGHADSCPVAELHKRWPDLGGEGKESDKTPTPITSRAAQELFG